MLNLLASRLLKVAFFIPMDSETEGNWQLKKVARL